MKNISIALIIVASMFTIACGERVMIEPGEVGRQLTSSGMEKENRPPGSFRMETCYVDACPKLVRLQMQLTTNNIVIDKLFLPKSNVDLTNVQVGLQFRVKPDDASVNKVYNEVRAEKLSDRQMGITSDQIYATYISRKAPDAIITALRDYTVDEVMTNVPEISKFVKDQINLMLKDTPIEVTEVGFPNGIGEPPSEVIAAKRALYAVEEQKARDLKALEADLVVEVQRQKIQHLRAQNDTANAAIAGTTFEKYTFLKVMESFADNKVPFTVVMAGSPVSPINMGSK